MRHRNRSRLLRARVRDKKVAAAPPPAPPARADGSAAPNPRRFLPEGSAARKVVPITSGLLDYFPDACAVVSNVSWLGNAKHNPGQPMHHARSKSGDHADCIARHLMQRGGYEYLTVDGVQHKVRHSGELAWRAMALLQEELEAELELTLPRGAKA